MPPRMIERSSFFVKTAHMPSPPPSASAPTSPMKTCAGYVLYQRNPMPAPTMAPQKIESSPTLVMAGMSR